MVDYSTHEAALRVCEQALGAAQAGMSPDLQQATARALDALGQEPAAALIGALLDHLLEHAETTDEELDRLEDAAALYDRGLKACAELAALRDVLEDVVQHPDDPGALSRFQDARDQLGDQQHAIDQLLADLQHFQATLSSTWLAPHGAPLLVSQWPWRDLLLGRRTTALLTALADGEPGLSDDERALLAGAVAGHAANAGATPYLNRVVGGPRRSHPYRHRLARYAAGTAIREDPTLGASSIADLRARLEAAFPDGQPLPQRLTARILTALAAAYPANVPPAPDLDRGYANLLRHLRLLDRFPDPPLPKPVPAVLVTRMLQAGQLTPQGTGPTPEPSDPPVTQIGSKDDDETTCKKILAIVATVLLAIVVAIVLAAGSSSSGTSTGTDPASSQQALEAWSATDEASAMIQALANVHAGLVDALMTAVTALELRGLLYPHADELAGPDFHQFVELPERVPDDYPHRPDPASSPLIKPDSPLERPATFPGPFDFGEPPSSALRGPDSVETLVLDLWGAALGHPASPVTGVNLDLDGDRGYLDACWRLEPGTTLAQDPVQTQTLGYAEI